MELQKLERIVQLIDLSEDANKIDRNTLHDLEIEYTEVIKDLQRIIHRRIDNLSEIKKDFISISDEYYYDEVKKMGIQHKTCYEWFESKGYKVISEEISDDKVLWIFKIKKIFYNINRNMMNQN